MALPEKVRVRLSSEAAGAISLTPVVAQDLRVAELVGHILEIAGKDEERIREILLRGSMVSGASRFRWAGWEIDPDALRAVLAEYPDPDPSRAFQAANCTLALLRGARETITVPRDAGRRKRLFDRRSFWDHLMVVAAEYPAGYAGYSYRERADRYVFKLDAPGVERIRAAAGIAAFSNLRDRLRTTAFSTLELFTTR